MDGMGMVICQAGKLKEQKSSRTPKPFRRLESLHKSFPRKPNGWNSQNEKNVDSGLNYGHFFGYLCLS